MLLKQKDLSLPRKLTLDFRGVANSVPNKGKSAVPPQFNGTEVLCSASVKAKLFAKNFARNSNLVDSSSSLPVYLLELI